MALVSAVLMLRLDPLSALTLMGVVLDLLLVWHTCTGIMALAAERGNSGLAAAEIDRYQRPPDPGLT